LFLSRVRCNIQTTVAFLTTRVKQPDEDDWGKLKRVLKYLHSTLSLPLTLFAKSLTNIIWYVDAAHQIHDSCKGHTSSVLTFAHGDTTSSSTKQKIPSKSSSESKLIGLYNKSSNILRTCQILEAQGYDIQTNIVYQDNMSTLSLAKNGCVSSSKHTKHIKAKYFFIHHFHNSGELDLQYCPTEQMWADILTKPLQGAKFCLMQAFLMNCPIDYSKISSMALTPVPTLVPTSLPTSKLATPFIPSSAPTNLPMKPQFLQPKPPLQGCVETKSHGTKVPSSSRQPILRKYKSKGKNVSWQDALFLHHPTQLGSRSLQSSTHSKVESFGS
jgi:hypothetical protein